MRRITWGKVVHISKTTAWRFRPQVLKRWRKAVVTPPHRILEPAPRRGGGSSGRPPRSDRSSGRPEADTHPGTKCRRTPGGRGSRASTTARPSCGSTAAGSMGWSGPVLGGARVHPRRGRGPGANVHRFLKGCSTPHLGQRQTVGGIALTTRTLGPGGLIMTSFPVQRFPGECIVPPLAGASGSFAPKVEQSQFCCGEPSYHPILRWKRNRPRHFT